MLSLLHEHEHNGENILKLLIIVIEITFFSYRVPLRHKFILFPETRAIACALAGTHASKFTCAIYRMRELIVFSCKEKFFIEGFSMEHN